MDLVNFLVVVGLVAASITVLVVLLVFTSMMESILPQRDPNQH